MKPKTTKLRQLQLDKQYLTNTQPEKVYQLIDSQLGLHSTDYWTPYLSIFARMGNFDTVKLFEDLNKGNDIFRIPGFRTTLHVVTKEKLATQLKVMAPILYKRLPPPYRKLDQDKRDKWITQVEEFVKGQSVSTNTIRKKFPELKEVLRWVLNEGMSRGLFIRGEASHARNSRTNYVLLEDIVPEVKKEIEDLENDEAFNSIVLDYITLFGPITKMDLAWWLPTTKSAVNTSLDSIGNEITEIKIEESNEPHYLTSTDFDTLESFDVASDPLVFFLPYEDHFTKGYSPRSRFFIDYQFEERISPLHLHLFWPYDHPSQQKPESKPKVSGEVRPSIWVNGKIVGRWEMNEPVHKTDGIDISYTLFMDPDTDVKTMIKEKAAEMHEFIVNSLFPISGK